MDGGPAAPRADRTSAPSPRQLRITPAAPSRSVPAIDEPEKRHNPWEALLNTLPPPVPRNLSECICSARKWTHRLPEEIYRTTVTMRRYNTFDQLRAQVVELGIPSESTESEKPGPDAAQA
ncbi:hypothetical protein GCM10010195_50230 [Kitasatospora griseola]|nr:hypothetical protein GCM10010195_50230 [Kitasatospora griseola]